MRGWLGVTKLKTSFSFGFSKEVVACCFFVGLTAYGWSEEPVIKFDIPALSCVRVIDDGPTSTGADELGEKIVEVVIPVSAQIRLGDRENVDEIRIDVFWNRNAYPLVDYGPKSQTTSHIEGVISVENSEEKNAGLGINLNGKYELISGGAKGDLSRRQKTTKRYQEVPEHNTLVASGSVKRGTGAFFRFHPSRTDMLEGGRELVLAFRVPDTWRAGILQVECRATGHRKVLAWQDQFKQERAFVMPIHLEGDSEAREFATGLAQSESDLKSIWRNQKNRSERSAIRWWGSSQSEDSKLPELWVHFLIQSGKDDYFFAYQNRLPDNVRDFAKNYVAARQRVLDLSR